MISRTKRVTNAVVDTTSGDLPSLAAGAIPDASSLVGKLPQALQDAIQQPTLDRFLDGNPKVINNDADYAQLVQILREQRARDIAAEAKKGKKDVESDETD